MYCMPYYLFCRFSSVQHSRKHSSTRHYSHFPLCTGRRNMVSIDFVSSENYTTCIIYTHTHTYIYIYAHTHIHTQSPQPCLTLCDLMNWSPPDSSVHGILLARILEWVAIYIHTHTHTWKYIIYQNTEKCACLYPI